MDVSTTEDDAEDWPGAGASGTRLSWRVALPVISASATILWVLVVLLGLHLIT